MANKMSDPMCDRRLPRDVVHVRKRASGFLSRTRRSDRGGDDGGMNGLFARCKISGSSCRLSLSGADA